MIRHRFALVAALASVLSPAPSRAGFVVAPMEISFEVGDGSTGTIGLQVRNTANAPLTLRLYSGDSRLEDDGSEKNLEPGVLERSCSPWVTVPENVFEFAAGETRPIPVRLEVPAGAQGSYWSKLYFEEISAPTVSTTSRYDRTYNILMRQRVAVRIYEDVPGTGRPDAVITNVIASGAPEGTTSIQVRVENPGNTLLRCTGRVELHDGLGTVAEKLPLGAAGRFVLFPGGSRDLTVTCTAPLAPGPWTALAVVDFGAEHLVAGDTVFDVGPSVMARGSGGN